MSLKLAAFGSVPNALVPNALGPVRNSPILQKRARRRKIRATTKKLAKEDFAVQAKNYRMAK